MSKSIVAAAQLPIAFSGTDSAWGVNQALSRYIASRMVDMSAASPAGLEASKSLASKVGELQRVIQRKGSNSLAVPHEIDTAVSLIIEHVVVAETVQILKNAMEYIEGPVLEHDRSGWMEVHASRFLRAAKLASTLEQNQPANKYLLPAQNHWMKLATALEQEGETGGHLIVSPLMRGDWVIDAVKSTSWPPEIPVSLLVYPRVNVLVLPRGSERSTHRTHMRWALLHLLKHDPSVPAKEKTLLSKVAKTGEEDE